MNLKEINEKFDRLDRAMYLNQRPMKYAEHYGGYQPDYQEESIEHNNWISEEVHYMGSQENFQFQPYNNNLSDWNQNVEYPQDQVYTPFQNQQGQGYFQPNQPFQDDEVKSMLKQLLEGQKIEKEEISKMKAYQNDLNSRIEGLTTHVKELENQIGQVASTSRINGKRVLPGNLEPNPRDYCMAIILRSEKELPSGNEPEETKKIMEGKLLVLKGDDSLQKVLKIKQDDFGLLDATKVGNEKLLDSHKIHDGETSFLELKEELNVMEIKEASNGKTSMESEGEAEKQDDWSKFKTPNAKIKPLPQELRYEFSDSNSTYPVIVNDTFSETETKTYLVEPISDGRWIPPMHVIPKKGGVTVINNDRDELIPTRTLTSRKMCLDYRELNASTRKNHFPWPFTDQMLSIFSGLIEIVVEVFRNDFSVYGDALVSCMSNLCRALKRYEGTNLVLNWKKYHFMEREGTILGPRTSEEDIEVDKAIAGPLTHLLYKETSFEFNEACLGAFTNIIRELVNESIVHVPDWSFPFESGGDFTATLSEPLTA